MTLCIRRPALLALSFLVFFTSACAAQQPTKRSGRTVPVRVFEQPSGAEAADFFREVKVFITWNGEELEAYGDPDDPNVVCGVPRVFYPPDGGGFEATRQFRPEKPARQVRWIARCAESGATCFGPEDEIVIRAKNPDRPDRSCRKQPPPDCADFKRQMTVAAKSVGKSLEAYVEAKDEASRRQQLTLFNPATQGMFAMPVDVCNGLGVDEGHQIGSLVSGHPNLPRFAHGPDIGWSYNVELWRDGKRLDCLDPDVWVEGDGHGGPGN